MTKKKSPIDLIKIIKLVFGGIVLLTILYIGFLIKIDRLKLKWDDTQVGICHRDVYGIRIDQKEIIRLPFIQDKSICL